MGGYGSHVNSSIAMCAGWLAGVPPLPCEGDSGGPLLLAADLDDPATHKQVGRGQDGGASEWAELRCRMGLPLCSQPAPQARPVVCGTRGAHCRMQRQRSHPAPCPAAPPPPQVGTVSGGAGECGGNALPGVFTKVPAYYDWIQQGLQAAQQGRGLPGGQQVTGAPPAQGQQSSGGRRRRLARAAGAGSSAVARPDQA